VVGLGQGQWLRVHPQIVGTIENIFLGRPDTGDRLGKHRLVIGRPSDLVPRLLQHASPEDRRTVWLEENPGGSGATAHDVRHILRHPSQPLLARRPNRLGSDAAER